jgi:hypothetical protein
VTLPLFASSIVRMQPRLGFSRRRARPTTPSATQWGPVSASAMQRMCSLYVKWMASNGPRIGPTKPQSRIFSFGSSRPQEVNEDRSRGHCIFSLIYRLHQRSRCAPPGPSHQEDGEALYRRERRPQIARPSAPRATASVDFWGLPRIPRGPTVAHCQGCEVPFTKPVRKGHQEGQRPLSAGVRLLRSTCRCRTTKLGGKN